MIYGVGVDLVRVDRIAQAIARYGDRFLERVFTPAEIAYCRSRARQGIWQFAQRFAAKEAFSKALGVGLRAGGIRWREVEVLPDSMGKPEIRISGRAQEFCRRADIRNIQLSLSDEDNHVIAMVLLET
jgi:holo-[acyl-carrier protein] synthase|uniref:Holo-[acyl-carrier-protein] synthase n=1 Tax=Desulfobacca acetoxidans TaxID=60893 RepID=A0A7C3SK78_9BACT